MNEPKPDNMPYAEWLKSKNIGVIVKTTCNEAGIPVEFLNKNKPTPELFERNRDRQGKVLDPEDI